MGSIWRNLGQKHSSSRDVFMLVILFVTVLTIGSGTLITFLWNAKVRFQDEAMLENARIYSEFFRNLQSYYTTEIISGIDIDLVEVTHDFRGKNNSLPFPATMIIDYSQYLSRSDSGFGASMLSNYPFDWRSNRLLTDFDSRALKYVSETGKEFYEFSDNHNRRNLRFASPIIMAPECVSCHNSHPASAKRDWQVGDVRGIHVLEIPASRIALGMQLDFSYLLVVVGSVAAFSGIAIVLMRNREYRILAMLELRNRELLRANVEKDHANEAKSQFLANISHEVRTPLNGILGLVDIMLKNNSENTDRINLKRIQVAGNVLLRIINDVLDLSKIEAEKISFEELDFETEEFVKNIIDLFAYQGMGNETPKLLVDLDPRLPSRMRGDPYRLSQIISNLLSNAFKFTSEGYIKLTVEFDVDNQEFIYLEVSDTGPGIPSDSQNKIFQPFTQSDNTVSRRFGGTGLGLAISRKLAEGMGGTLELSSETEKGATFILRLPLNSSIDDVAPKIVPLAPEGVQCVHILDNDDVHCAILSRMLQRIGIEVNLLRDLSEASEILDLNAGRQPPANNVVLVCVSDKNENNYLHYIEANYSSSLAVLFMQEDAQARETYNTGWVILPNDLVELLASTVRSDVQQDDFRINVNEQPYFSTVEVSNVESALSRLRVLIVDDNELNLLVARAFLENEGARVQLAKSGSEAIAIVNEKEFDIVLMDIQMPEMDGYETASKIALSKPRLPIIALTANAQQQDQDRSKKAGFVAHLEKPLNRSTLVEALAAYFNADRNSFHRG